MRTAAAGKLPGIHFVSLSQQFKKYYRNQPPVIDHSLCTKDLFNSIHDIKYYLILTGALCDGPWLAPHNRGGNRPSWEWAPCPAHTDVRGRTRFIQTPEQVFLITTYIGHMLSTYITNNSYHLLTTFSFFEPGTISSFNLYKNPMEWLLTLVFLFYCHANWVTERLGNQHKVIQLINGKLYPVWFLERSRCLWIHLDPTKAFCVYYNYKECWKVRWQNEATGWKHPFTKV